MKYEGTMDKECIEFCDTLNSIKGVKTFSSCCGHLKAPYRIDMTINNKYALALITRAFDERYSNGMWRLNLCSLDTPFPKTGTVEIYLNRIEIFNSQEEMENEIKEAINNLNYWRQKKFKKHLLGKE